MTAPAAPPRLIALALAAAIGAGAPAAPAAAQLMRPAAPAFPDFSSAQRLMTPRAAAEDLLSAARRALEPGFAPARVLAPPEAPPAPAPSVALPPLPAAVEAALAGFVAEKAAASPAGAGDWRAAREAIQDFYAARDFAPVWVTDGGLTGRAEGVLARLRRAGEDGLDLSAFALPEAPLSDLSPARLAERRSAVLDFISAALFQNPDGKPQRAER